MGGISESAKDLIDHLYARGEQEKRRRWDSETMRIALKKEFVDRLSMVLCIRGMCVPAVMYSTDLQENFKPVAHRSASVEVFDEEDAQVVHPSPSYWGCQGT